LVTGNKIELKKNEIETREFPFDLTVTISKSHQWNSFSVMLAEQRTLITFRWTKSDSISATRYDISSATLGRN